MPRARATVTARLALPIAACSALCGPWVSVASTQQPASQTAPNSPSSPTAPAPVVQPKAPIWRASLGTSFYPLTFEQALEKAAAEVKLVSVFVIDSSNPAIQDEIAHMRNTTWRNPTLATYLGWRFITIEVDAAFEPWIREKCRLSKRDLPAVVALQPPGGEVIGKAIRQWNPLSAEIERYTPRHLLDTVPDIVPTATNVLFQMDFAHERLAARDPVWGATAAHDNPMPKAPRVEDPMHQVEDQGALPVADPAPDDHGWRAGGKPAAPVPMVSMTKRPVPTFNHAPYDVMERLTEARAAIESNDARLATGLYTWLWERSEEMDPASRAFRRCVLPAEIKEFCSVNDMTRERFAGVRDQASRRLLWAGFSDLMLWFTLNEICGDDGENVQYLDLYTNDRDEATMLPRAQHAAYRLMAARDHFIDPWRIDAPARVGSKSAMPRDADEAALAHLRAIAKRLTESQDPKMTPEEFESLQVFRRAYLIDEAVRLHVALLREGRDTVALQAIEIARKATMDDAERAQLFNSAVFCALATDQAREMHSSLLAEAAVLGRANLTLELRLKERQAAPAPPTPTAAPAPAKP